MAEGKRSSEDIRRDIAQEQENLSQTAEQIGARVKEKLDWRAQTKNSPYWALGAATGLGFFASKVFARRATPTERILDSLAEDVRGSLGRQLSKTFGTVLIRKTVQAIVVKSAAHWIMHGNHLNSESRDDDGSRPRSEQDSHIDPETNR